MDCWQAEPYWQTLAELTPVPITATDTLTPAVSEYAGFPRLAGRGYRGLDMLRSQMRQGYSGVIVRLR